MHISFGEIAQLITAVAALGALLATLVNRGKIREVHLSLNSRLDQLLRVTAEKSHAEGVETERERIQKGCLTKP